MPFPLSSSPDPSAADRPSDDELTSYDLAENRSDERERLQALYRYEILDTLPEKAFDHATQLAAYLFDAPYAAVSLIDKKRHWFKSCLGLEADEMDLENSFCARAIQSAGVTVIEDALEQEPFASMPVVDGGDGVRFYIGAPLTTSDGHNIGTLCVLDDHPRSRPDDEKLQHLQNLAHLVVDELELRFEMKERTEKTQSLRQTAQRAEIARATAENARAAAEEAREEAEEASRSKSRFLTGMAHDIRSPISAIDGYAQLLSRTLEHPSAEYAERILQATRHLNDMADSLSELAELESGSIDLTVETKDVVPIVREQVDALQARADEEGIRLEVSMPDGPVPAQTNARALRRVLDNLISNSLKYCLEGDRVCVSVSPSTPDASAVCIEVDDSGPGIEEEFLDIMYEPFTQRDTNADGSGLGLAVTKELVEAMDARIDVSSPSDHGTTFFVLLKPARGGAAPSESDRRADQTPSTQRPSAPTGDDTSTRRVSARETDSSHP
jgi:signal transduction histidine kinase